MTDWTVALDASLIAGNHTGDTAYWCGLVHGLARLDQCATVFLFFNGKVPEGIPEVPHLVPIGLPRMSSRWHSLVRWPLLARRMRADVLHTQYNLSPLVGRRGVTTIHDVSFFIGPEWFQPRDRYVLQTMIPRTVNRAAAVITVSETSRREIEKFIPTSLGKTHVTYNALSPTFRPQLRKEAKRLVANRFGMCDPYALTVGTRWPRKNMRLAVEAIAATTCGLSLAVTGKAGWGEESLGTAVKATGYVNDEELASLYAAADVYLAPSRHEGFGIPLLEAWASQTPVICSSGGALPEIAGEAAVVMPGWDAASWAIAIDELMNDSGKVERLRELGTARLTDFDWKTTAEKTFEIYQDVAL